MNPAETRDATAPKVDCAVDRLQRRHDEIMRWLENEAPDALHDQRHLDAGSQERAYWHYGYLTAIKDMLALLGNASTSHH